MAAIDYIPSKTGFTINGSVIVGMATHGLL